jgi:deoxyribose-phosphate aldolase
MAKAPALPSGFELPLEPRLPRIGSVDQVAVEERAATLARRSIKREAKLFALDLAVRMIDLTTLEGQDTPGKIAALASKAIRPDPSDATIPSVAAVCVYPNLVPTALEKVKGSSVKVASVATAFPSGQSPTPIKVAEVRDVVELGADEVDMVIDRGAFLSGRYAKVYDEICQVKEAAGDAHLKVILEVGELGTYDNVRRASLLAMAAGADFIKTSTGKLPQAATQGGHEAGRRHPPGEAGRPVPRPALRDARRRVADAGSLPARRLDALERRVDADPEGEDGPLPKPGLLHD